MNENLKQALHIHLRLCNRNTNKNHFDQFDVCYTWHCDTSSPFVIGACILTSYFGQLTEMAFIFSVFTNLIWTMTEILPKKNKKKQKNSAL